MNLRSIWNDDSLAFIAFLFLILPLPFIYAALDILGVASDATVLSYYSFLGWGVLWMSLAIIYTVGLRWFSSDEEEVDELK